MSLRHNVISSSPVRCTRAGSMPRMFLWSRQQHRGQQGSDVTSCRHTELQNCNCSEGGRSAHRACAPSRRKKQLTLSGLEKWNAVSALKAGEDRATYLGMAMLICSIVLAFLLGTKLVHSYNESVWKGESKCTVIETRITNCTTCIQSCVSNCQKPSHYPCIQIYVNLSASGSRALLHHSEESVRANSECFCATKCNINYSETEMLIASITENNTQSQPIPFSCYYDPGQQNNVLLTRFDLPTALLNSAFWPMCMFACGAGIIIMVKMTQYLSLLKEQLHK
ncbi:calcium-activated potassium channel subunit beta-2 isoform X1 [Scyliorhinus canicula]|uniref:calcium-activated potassium channel subunit beta-2 isoform X1 n=1 Tax=Scyliorhinus canicula TaxID=7830 RepID=UPI0018F44DA7|nr:calcium-activated potassium channel subunit beta-2 isoform X1 [Scyliorhinus canicula]